jgi:Zn-dependent peptidase ImmA (M78 family)
MNVERSSTFFQEVIQDLYKQAEMSVPTAHYCIAPINMLIAALDLVCVEIPLLTQESAMRYLYEQGALVDLPEHSPREPLAGFLYVNTHYGCLFLEQNDPLVRRRFSVAHELGHYVLHFQPLIMQYEHDNRYLELMESFHLTESDEDGEVNDVFTGGSLIAPWQNIAQLLPPFEQMEQEANQFAAMILMPEDVIRGLCARSVTLLQDQELVWRLSTDLLVSAASVRYRLKGLNLLPSLAK